MADPEVEVLARNIAYGYCAHTGDPQPEPVVCPDCEPLAQEIATALRAAREEEFVSGAEEGYESGYAAGRWDGMRTANACTEGTHTPETCTCPYARGYAAGIKAARPAAPPEEEGQ